MRTTLSLLALGTAVALSGTAHAALVTDTDSFGIVWTLESDGVNHGTAAAPVYDVFVFANTSGFSATSGSTTFTNANAYINDISILAASSPTGASTLGPGNMANAGLWGNILGGQNNNGCDGTGADFDCAYSTSGGTPPGSKTNPYPTGPGILLNSTETNLVTPLVAGANLEWEFALDFASSTTDPLSFLSDGSHLKVDYYGNDSKGYDFLGMISDDVTINDVCTTGCTRQVPEPSSLALFGAALLGGALFLRRRRVPNV